MSNKKHQSIKDKTILLIDLKYGFRIQESLWWSKDLRDKLSNMQFRKDLVEKLLLRIGGDGVVEGQGVDHNALFSKGQLQEKDCVIRYAVSIMYPKERQIPYRGYALDIAGTWHEHTWKVFFTEDEDKKEILIESGRTRVMYFGYPEGELPEKTKS